MKNQSFVDQFLKKFVFPYTDFKEITNNNIKDLIFFIEEAYTKPMSIELASGNEIDFDFFDDVNYVINELSLTLHSASNL